ncbi:MAG: metal ABC transporter ATP-binding protein [Candidatus Eremiobacteraeota bacterium]|nr:metal ABC transporter ATP-binding protein [Candidatus Eremiobacteraeota bacterium]
MRGQKEGHDHTHVEPTDDAAPLRHHQAIAPATPHLHEHAGHRAAAAAEVSHGGGVALSVSAVCAGYFGRDVLDEVSFCVETGEFVGIIGPNGSGKSTLLKVIAGLHPLQCGRISVFGARPGSSSGRRVGYVPQVESVNWSFPVSVLDVVLMGTFKQVGWFRRPGAADRAAALSALRDVGMAERAGSQIGRLSGGQQQRVFIARALVQQPQLLLLDEPIAGVDATTQHAIFTLLEERQRAGMTIVATTHDLSCVTTWFDRVLCLNHRVVAYGPPAEVLDDETLSATYGSHLLTIPRSAATARSV